MKQARTVKQSGLGANPASQVIHLNKKIFYKIGEVSRMTGLESYVLRFWENEFSVLQPRKNSGGQRVYMPKDIEMILKIKKMLYEEGFTIAGAKKILKRNLSSRQARPSLQKIQSELKGILDLLH